MSFSLINDSSNLFNDGSNSKDAQVSKARISSDSQLKQRQAAYLYLAKPEFRASS
jgi:hypothetical protein